MDIEDIRRQNLEQLIRDRYKNQAGFVRETGVNQGEISGLINKKRVFGERKARKLEKITGLPPGWMDQDHVRIGTPVESVDDRSPPADAVQIRRVQFNVSAGISGTVIDQEEVQGNPIYFRQDWLTKKGWFKEKLVAVFVKGESMEPGLYAGDTIIVNTGDTEPHDGDVYVVRYEGETVIKRLLRDAGKWWLSSDNPDKRRFPRKECLDDICEIIGKVVYKQSERV